jgi:hypothetical protein
MFYVICAYSGVKHILCFLFYLCSSKVANFSGLSIFFNYPFDVHPFVNSSATYFIVYIRLVFAEMHVYLYITIVYELDEYIQVKCAWQIDLPVS